MLLEPASVKSVPFTWSVFGAPRLQSPLNMKEVILNKRRELFLQADELDSDTLKLFVRHLVETNKARACAFNASEKLIELQGNHLGLPVLGILNQEHHQERDDCRSRVDDELPRIRVVEHGTGHGPSHDDQEG